MPLLGLCLAIASLGAPASEPVPRRLAVAPLAVEGPLPPAFRERADERIVAGTRRGAIDIVALDPGAVTECEDTPCLAALAGNAGADWLLVPTIVVDPQRRSYRFSGTIVDARGREVFAVEEGCEVCGFEEAIGLVEDRLASTAERLGRSDADTATAVVGGSPAGATVTIDGDPAGTLPLTARVSAGPHRIAVTKPGFLAQALEIDVPAGARQEVQVRLQVDPSTRATDRERARARIMVGTGTGIGVASLVAIAAGGALVAVHGRPWQRECEADIEGNCRHLLGTRPGGIAALVSGGVGLAVGVALVVIGRKRARSGALGRRARLQGWAASPTRSFTIWSRAAATSEPSSRAF